MVESFFGIPKWNIFHSMEEKKANIIIELEKIIKDQNLHRYIVVYEKFVENDEQVKIDLYKKHVTQFVKFIVIGQLNLMQFADLKKFIDEIVPQSEILKAALSDRPEVQKVYFP